MVPIALVPATFSWWETRRQRLLLEGAAQQKSAPPQPAPSTGSWRAGFYDYPPLSSISDTDDSAASGLLVTLANGVLDRLGKSADFCLFTYDDFYQDGAKIPDMVVGMFETKRRAKRMVFSIPLYEIALQGICRIDQQGDVLEALHDGKLRVAVYSAEVGWEFVNDELADAVEQHRVATLNGGHQMHTMGLLTQGTYDVVIMDQLSCHNFLSEGDHRSKFKLAFDASPKTYSVCISLRPDHAAMLDDVNAAILSVRNSPEFLEAEHQALAGFDHIINRRALRRPKS